MCIHRINQTRECFMVPRSRSTPPMPSTPQPAVAARAVYSRLTASRVFFAVPPLLRDDCACVYKRNYNIPVARQNDFLNISYVVEYNNNNMYIYVCVKRRQPANGAVKKNDNNKAHLI